MRSKPLLPALLLVGAGLSPLAQASSDDSCYPDWSLVGGGVCDTLPFLAPGNDTRANLRLLLADAGHWRLVEAPPSEEEKLEGYGLVPFGLFRLLPGDGSQPPAPPAASEAETPPPAPAPSPLAELARQMGAEALPEKIAGAEFFEGEGSRCRSNDQDSALAFLRQVRDAGLGEAETKAWPTAAWTCSVPAAGNKRNWAVCSRKASSRPQARPSPRTWRLRPTSTAVASTKPNRASRRCRTCRSPG